MAPAKKMTAKELRDRLQRHYIAPGDALPGGVFLPEVTMGRAGGGRVDAVYVGFTSSRGELLTGHEIKVSRADWLHELDQPDKAEVWASQCHAWYAVAPDTTIIRPEELPHGWGLMVVNPRTRTRLDVIVKAAVDPDRQPSWLTAHSLLKKQDTRRAGEVAELRRDAKRQAMEEMVAEMERRASNGQDEAGAWRRRAERAERAIAELGKALGVGEDAYSVQNLIERESVREYIADLVRNRISLDRAVVNRRWQLQGAEQALSSALNAVQEASKAIEGLGA